MNSTSENPGSLILKTDSRGRMRFPLEKREALLDEFAKSGLSGIKFAALSGIKYQTFANWVQQRRRKQTPSSSVEKRERKSNSVSWLEAVVEQACPQPGRTCGSLILQLPGGGRIELAGTSEIALAAALLRALDKPC